MHKKKWFTLGAAATLFAATPAFASDEPCSCCNKAEPGSAAHASAMHEHGPATPASASTAPRAGKAGKAAKGRTVNVAVTSDGFVPAVIPAKKGEVLNLVVTRKIEQTCATELVQKEQGVNAPLPLGEPVTVTLRAPKDGQLRFSCAHGHIAGNVVVTN